MTAPKIELKNFKSSDFASQETLCFQATVYVNNKRAGIAENGGHGGNTVVHWKSEVLADIVRAHVATLPPVEFEAGGKTFSYEQDVDSFISELADKTHNDNWLKRRCRSKTLFRLKSQPKGEYMSINYKYNPDVAAQLRVNHGDDLEEIINERFSK